MGQQEPKCKFCEHSKALGNSLHCVKNKVPVDPDDYCELFEQIKV